MKVCVAILHWLMGICWGFVVGAFFGTCLHVETQFTE